MSPYRVFSSELSMYHLLIEQFFIVTSGFLYSIELEFRSK
jgi:hypothetical protein